MNYRKKKSPYNDFGQATNTFMYHIATRQDLTLPNLNCIFLNLWQNCKGISF